MSDNKISSLWDIISNYKDMDFRFITNRDGVKVYVKENKLTGLINEYSFQITEDLMLASEDQMEGIVVSHIVQAIKKIKDHE